MIDAWVKQGKVGRDQVRETVDRALREQAFTPLLSHEPLINVLELNVRLRQRLEQR